MEVMWQGCRWWRECGKGGGGVGWLMERQGREGRVLRRKKVVERES